MFVAKVVMFVALAAGMAHGQTPPVTCPPDNICLVWDAPLATDGQVLPEQYKLLRWEAMVGPVEVARIPATETTYRDTAVVARKQYCYQLIAIAGEDESKPSNPACARVPATVSQAGKVRRIIP